ncbi:MAG: TIR domain-containing protein [Planctomycetota bacterium]|nr:TIR domain-containing protein [Planctomycetota bacterium]
MMDDIERIEIDHNYRVHRSRDPVLENGRRHSRPGDAYRYTRNANMSDVTVIERRQLEKLFEMGGGYVLDFSNRTLQEFIADTVGKDIEDERYHYASGSKANRLRAFWRLESNEVVGKLTAAMVQYAETLAGHPRDPGLIAACQRIAERLFQDAQSPDLGATTTCNSGDSAELPSESPDSSNKAARPGSGPASKPPSPVRAFISYSWDSETHKAWARRFADQLVTNGVEIIVDQYDLTLGADRFQFMESSVREADVVLCVCTPNYVDKANRRVHGVGVETAIMTPQFFDRIKREKQFIPVIRESTPDKALTPDYMSALVFVDFRDDDQFENRMEELLRHLHNQPKRRKPPRGPIPAFGYPFGTGHALIIEDDMKSADGIGHYLESAGWSTAITYSLQPALELARRHPPDVILADIWYFSPDNGDDYEGMVSRLRKLSPRVRIIAMTGRDLPIECVHLFDRVMRKPIRWEELCHSINELCQ